MGNKKFNPISLEGFGLDIKKADLGTLAERFIVPPFSVLSARDGVWQKRKKAWISLGIESELGRGGDVTWGNSPEITEKGLNFYRNKKKKRQSSKLQKSRQTNSISKKQKIKMVMYPDLIQRKQKYDKT